MTGTLVVASYNVLAEAYADPRFYPRTPASALERHLRRERLALRVASLGADIVCLQEVEADLFAMLDERLAPDGFTGDFLKKSGRKPDGCATFVRRPLVLRDRRALVYGDASGHIAQLLTVDAFGEVVGVANTHLKWEAPGTPLAERWSPGQIAELLAAIGDHGAWIVCGDLNVEPTTDVLSTLGAAGFVDPHDGAALASCNANGHAKRIDFVLARGLVGTPLETPIVEDETPLPSDEEPSDHVPLRASFVRSDRLAPELH